ncbi:spondin domain-containing protein [Ferrimonas marina]|uniref:Spondin_N n=1 Tax=Ferrimonas marina TaxID=299255 RepID=A0A1M5S878_9GAMM|nr:spondin domain-containing protein [Ferrimonas marina]SHH34681.1 Spondin_N [Ferrimonas marina]
MKMRLMMLPLFAAALLTGCDDDDNGTVTVEPSPAPPAPAAEPASFDITVVNLTSAQPMSPLAAYLHAGDVSGWTFGMPASEGLEILAEAGDGSQWLTMADEAGALASGSGDGILMPGASQTLTLELEAEGMAYLTLATMLVNTNDAFAGINGKDLMALAVSESMTMNLPVYDAGTEGNSELAATIPGPAGGGAGYDAMRDDVDYVARHPGVVTADDGYVDSALASIHRFDAPVARLVVTRTR